MDTLVQQVKTKSKPPPPPPPKKPSHLTAAQSKPAPPPPPPRSQPSSRKRGLGWPWDQPSAHLPLYTTIKISWLFNWELWIPPSLPASVEWVPCIRTASHCRDILPFLTDITVRQGRKVTCLLGFNEPEVAGQADLGFVEAAALWREFVLPAKKALGVRLGSPGMSSEEGRAGEWVDGFLGEIQGGTGWEAAGVDFLVVHWYGLDFREMRGFLERMYSKYRLPVWLNEFACSRMGEGEVGRGEVEDFLKEAIPWLEETEWIERYAYFGHGQGQDVGTWVGRANNFTEDAQGLGSAAGKRLSKVGQLYLDL